MTARELLLFLQLTAIFLLVPAIVLLLATSNTTPFQARAQRIRFARVAALIGVAIGLLSLAALGLHSCAHNTAPAIAPSIQQSTPGER